MGLAWAILCEPTAEVETKVELGSFRAGREPRLSEGEHAILFTRTGAGVSFWGKATVGGMLEPETRGGVRSFTRPLNEIRRFHEARSLDDFRFSLQRVRRLRKPHLSFMRRYSRLSIQDVESLESNEIFWARTAFGLLSESIPSRARVAFLQRWISRARRNWRELATDLYEQTVERYSFTAQLLQQVRQEFERVAWANEAPSTLMASTEDVGSDIDIIRLADRARPFAAALPQPAIRRIIEHDQPSETAFRFAFPTTDRELALALGVI